MQCLVWLLHEERLRAEIPIFCVHAIWPHLENAVSPLSIRLGCIQLLLLLHSRLEVIMNFPEIVASAGNSSGEEDDIEMQSIWKV